MKPNKNISIVTRVLTVCFPIFYMYLSMECTCTSQIQLVMTILNKIMISRYHCKWRIKNPDKNIVFFFCVKHLLRMLFNFFWVPWFVVYALHIMVLGEVYQNILINPHCEIFIVFFIYIVAIILIYYPGIYICLLTVQIGISIIFIQPVWCGMVLLNINIRTIFFNLFVL